MCAYSPVAPRYDFTQNDPFDRGAPIRMVLPAQQSSRDYMNSIRDFEVPEDAFAVWYMGQNGFLLKDPSGYLVGIDLYLSNSCAATFAHLPFRLDRQLPIFIEPEDLAIDVFITTHSHDDHADPETIRRVNQETMLFVGPFDSLRVYSRSGVAASQQQLLHPGETITLFAGLTAEGTFALPTDNTDLNHLGVLLKFGNGNSFYNTGDTAYAEHLEALLPESPDVCAICINGGFRNLTSTQAAAIVQAIRPHTVIPCHYDMMVNNIGSPDAFRMELERLGSRSVYLQLSYYEPWVYRRGKAVTLSAEDR